MNYSNRTVTYRYNKNLHNSCMLYHFSCENIHDKGFTACYGYAAGVCGSLCIASLSAEQLQTVTRYMSSQITISCDLFALYGV